MPTTSTWGGLRWRREVANADGNHYVGYTGLDSTDDLVFGSNNGGTQINNNIRITKAGLVGIGTIPTQKFHVSGIAFSDTDFRAPIFYDSNNTAFYVDPASVSNLNAAILNRSGSDGYLTLPGSVTVSNVSSSEIVLRNLTQLRFSTSTSWDWNAWAGLKYDASATTIYLGGPAATTVFTANATPPTVTVSFVGTNAVSSNSDFRAPIFYDSNNTAYYIDAASTSNLVGLTVANTITGSISGNAATATNSSQLGGVAAASYVRNDVDGTDSTALFRLTTITKSLTITTSWLDTGIIGANLATGCYMISLYVDNYAVNGGHYQETYTGIMSWFSTGTNATDYDEIVLHKSGHAPNGAYINLRTIRQLSGGTNLKLQIISSVSTNGASSYVFKFRRLI